MNYNKCVVCGLYELDEELNTHICQLKDEPVHEVKECFPPHFNESEEKKEVDGGGIE